MILTEKQQKYQHYHQVKLINMILAGEEIISPNQRQIIEHTKFTCSILGKALEKKKKTIKDQGRKQIDAITNQNKTLAALSNKDDHDHKDIYKEIYNDKETLLFP